MANRYYTSFPLSLGEVVLQGAEAHHLATVMRAHPGDAVCLFNGDGFQYPATVITVSKREVTLRIYSVEQPHRELPFSLEIAAAVPKGVREDFLLEKLTELGVTHFVPLITERSVVIPKVERLQRTVAEASKQCGRNVLMEVAAVTRWSDYLLGSANIANRWLAHPHSSPASVFGCLSPEGGFTNEEVNAATAAGWQCVDLGPRILRVETAAVALAAYCSLSANKA